MRPARQGPRNPYRYDGRDGARYDAETGLYWLSVRAYDPTLGRFLSHDPLGRAPLFFADQPYAYAGNNPLLNVDPSGQRMATSDDAGVRVERAADVRASRHYAQHHARVYAVRPQRACAAPGHHPSCAQIKNAQQDAQNAAGEFIVQWGLGAGALAWLGSTSYGKPVATWLKNVLLKVGKWLLGKMNLALSGAAAATFLNSAWLTFALANIVVGIMFLAQSWASDTYWMNASQVPNVLGFMRAAFITAGLVLLLGAVVSSIAAPEIAWIWWGAVAGLVAAYWEIAPRALADLHGEQRDLGYAYTY
jgi:RHS repeat-associated protein